MAENSSDFAGLRVAAFESRRAEEIRRLIERFGGVPLVSPSMREVSLDDHREAVEFAHRLISGQVDVVIFMTGVGAKHLLTAVERKLSRQRFLDSLSDVTTIVRGPKPLVVLREWGIQPTHLVPEPNTWRELLQTIDQKVPVANQVVALQEYGLPNSSLIAGLEARGAQVLSVRVYAWDFPEDTAPLEENVRVLAGGGADVVMFTSSQQILNVLEMADRLGLKPQVRAALDQLVVASIGPTTSETLHQLGIGVDFEPDHSKMGHLVSQASQQAQALLDQKRRYQRREPAQARDDSTSTTGGGESLFIRACRRQPVERTPIWLMRQAGRYMPEYRAVREKTTFLELCKNPQLCAEVMVTAVQRLNVDAAIIFADLLPILEPMGFELEYAVGEGPLIHNPVREAGDLFRVHELESVASLDFIVETVKATRAALPPEIPVLGFAGAPFTLASYAIEGGGSRHYLHTKTLMYRDPGAWNELMGRLVRAIVRLLTAQIEAGAEAVQIFDSWAGCLGPEDYRRFVLPHTKAVIDQLPIGAPVINFATGNPALLPALAEAGGDVIGIDWRIRLDEAWRTVGHHRAVQGNLDPAVLLADRHEIRRAAVELLSQAGNRPGHIFNLGHGVLPQTPPDNVRYLVDLVQELSQRS